MCVCVCQRQIENEILAMDEHFHHFILPFWLSVGVRYPIELSKLLSLRRNETAWKLKSSSSNHGENVSRTSNA